MDPSSNYGSNPDGGNSASSAPSAEYTHQYSKSKLESIQREVDQVTGIMGQNLDKVMQRGDNLDDLQAKADNLNTHANQFQQTSRNLKRKMWWKNIKMMIIIGVVVFVIIVIIIIAAVAGSGGGDSGSGGSTPTKMAAVDYTSHLQSDNNTIPFNINTNSTGN